MIQAVIFDFDGTIVDNEGEWERIFRQVWEEYSGQKTLDKKWLHQAGMGVVPNWKKMVKDPEIVRRLADRTFELYAKESAQKAEVEIREGVVEAIEAVKLADWMTALATGSNWTAVEKELEQLGLYLAFDMTTTGEEVLFQKPDPEIYILTAQKLGVDFSECLVVEDSVPGIEAGIAAGMTVVGLVTEYSNETKLRAAGANFVINNFNEMVDLVKDIKDKEQVVTPDEEE